MSVPHPPSAPPDYFLSHALDPLTPAYGGATGFERHALTSIASGATANSERWSFPNHLGTHVDAPRHFVDDGATIDSFSPSSWWFQRPVLVDVDAAADDLILPQALESYLPLEADIVLIRTGFESKRTSSEYWSRNPGLSKELALWCRAERPKLRAIGVDTISVTARAHREQGRAAHRAFLGSSGSNRPLLLVEDMALALVTRPLAAVCVAPLRVTAGDGGPCTVLAWTTAIE